MRYTYCHRVAGAGGGDEDDDDADVDEVVVMKEGGAPAPLFALRLFACGTREKLVASTTRVLTGLVQIIGVDHVPHPTLERKFGDTLSRALII
jgi:hypothetical protein